jgi:tetratricopeptide (TPR) repeat protein
MAGALGIGSVLDFEKKQREHYAYGYQIGEGVGKEHAHQWLAMDLKLEHFVGSEKVSHVDHSDDVMLFREPTAEECAKSVAPLYQQMEYALWHAFRDGYWDVRRRDALDVLLIFDGPRVGEILGLRGVKSAVKARNAERWDDAFKWCDDAQAALEAFRGSNDAAGVLYLTRLDLVRGDILYRRGSFKDALEKYDTARKELERMVAQGAPCEFEIASALINSAAVLSSLGRRVEARARLLEARTQTTQMPEDDPRIQFVADAVSQNLAGLEEVDQKKGEGESLGGE